MLLEFERRGNTEIQFETRGNTEIHSFEPEPSQDFDRNDDSDDMTLEDEGREGPKTVFASKECFEIKKYKDEILSWFGPASIMVNFPSKERSRYGSTICNFYTFNCRE